MFKIKHNANKCCCFFSIFVCIYYTSAMPCSNEFSSSWENGISITHIDVSFKSNFQTEY